MDWTSFIGPAVIAAAVSGVISVVGMFVNRQTVIRTSNDKIAADIQLTERKFKFDQDLAERKFTYDRQQAVHKRRFELAEQVLSDAYRFRDMMKFVRNSAGYIGEGATRRSEKPESEKLKRVRDTYFVPIERLKNESEFLSSMMARRETCMAHFGNDAESAYSAFNSAIHSVRVASRMLIELSGDQDRNRELVVKLQNDIWEPQAEFQNSNDIGQKINEAVLLVEGFCIPVLRQEALITPDPATRS